VESRQIRWGFDPQRHRLPIKTERPIWDFCRLAENSAAYTRNVLFLTVTRPSFRFECRSLLRPVRGITGQNRTYSPKENGDPKAAAVVLLSAVLSELCRFSSSGYSDQTQQAGAEEPDCSKYQHRTDIARMNSSRYVGIVLVDILLKADQEAEGQRVGID